MSAERAQLGPRVRDTLCFFLIPKEAFDDFMSTFTTSESQQDGKKVLSPDFDKWLDKQIKESKTKPLVDKTLLCPYDKQYKSSSSTISSSCSASTSEEEESVEEITQ